MAGQLSCQHRPGPGSEVIGIPVQRHSDCSSKKLSPLVSIRDWATGGLFMAAVVIVKEEWLQCVCVCV